MNTCSYIHYYQTKKKKRQGIYERLLDGNVSILADWNARKISRKG
jgi:hypothetical protein